MRDMDYSSIKLIIYEKQILFILMALLFGLVQAEAKGSSGDALSYEIEGAGTGMQGTYLVKVWVLSSKKQSG